MKISVGEMHLNGLRITAKSYGMKDCYQFDLLDTPFEKWAFKSTSSYSFINHILTLVQLRAVKEHFSFIDSTPLNGNTSL